MILVGVAATPDHVIGDGAEAMYLAPGAIDCDDLVPLCHQHSRRIGNVISLCYVGPRLIATVETSDDAGRTANFMSASVRVLSNIGAKVTRARLLEISLTGHPRNPDCKIFERRESDPLREMFKAKANFHDAMISRVRSLMKQGA